MCIFTYRTDDLPKYSLKTNHQLFNSFYNKNLFKTMVLHKSSFLEISQMPEINGIKIQWLADTSKMRDEDFKAQILSEKKAIDDVKPQNIFADILQMKFSIEPNLQAWHNELIFPAFKAAKTQKLAILVSTDLFVQVSVEQLVEDANKSQKEELVTKYFDEEFQAIAWLKS